jgi:hypothetical protein
VSVERREICTDDNFQTVNLAGATFALADDNPNAVEAPCNLIVTMPFQVGYQYKITPTTNLECLGNDGIDSVWVAPYFVSVRSQCFADVDGSGRVDIDDLLSVVGLWGPCPPSPATCEADILPHACGGGTVDIDDLLAVIGGWGLDCPTGDFEDVGSLSSVQDCMEAATQAEFEPFSAEWDDFVNKCVDGLCQAQIIVCD